MSEANEALLLSTTPQDRSQLTVVTIYCQPAHEVLIDQADQVIANGATGLSASCPVDREIVYGFALQRYEHTDASCLPSGFAMCTPGATSCTQPSCLSGNSKDMSIIFLVCAPVGLLVDAASPPLMVSDSASSAAEATKVVTAACASGYTGAWGQTISFPHKDRIRPKTDNGAGSPLPIELANIAFACNRAGMRGCGFGEDTTCSMPSCERLSNPKPPTTFAFMLCYPSAQLDAVTTSSSSSSNAGKSVLLEIGMSGGAGAPITAVGNATSPIGSSATTLDTMYGSATAPAAPPGLSSTLGAGTGGSVNLFWLAELGDRGGAPVGAPQYEAGAAVGPCPTEVPTQPAGVTTRGLVLHLDAGDAKSYSPGTGVWKDVSGNVTTGVGAEVTGTNPRTWRVVKSTNVNSGGAAQFTSLALDGIAAVRVVLHAPGAQPPALPPAQAMGVYSVEVLDGDGKLCQRQGRVSDVCMQEHDVARVCCRRHPCRHRLGSEHPSTGVVGAAAPPPCPHRRVDCVLGKWRLRRRSDAILAVGQHYRGPLACVWAADHVRRRRACGVQRQRAHGSRG